MSKQRKKVVLSERREKAKFIYYNFAMTKLTNTDLFFIFIFLLLCYHSCPSFSFSALLLLAHSPHSQSPHHCPCPWVIHTCSFTSPFSFFPPLFPSPFPRPAVSLFYVFMSLLLFCLLVYILSIRFLL